MDQSSVNMIHFATFDTLGNHTLLQYKVAVCAIDEFPSGKLNACVNLPRSFSTAKQDFCIER
jgi:hypothetical protein